MGSLHGRVGIYTRGTTRMIREMDMVRCTGLMVAFIKVNGRMGYSMVQVCFCYYFQVRSIFPVKVSREEYFKITLWFMFNKLTRTTTNSHNHTNSKSIIQNNSPINPTLSHRTTTKPVRHSVAGHTQRTIMPTPTNPNKSPVPFPAPTMQGSLNWFP